MSAPDVGVTDVGEPASLPRAPVVHISGFPGSGKKTVGRLVADALGGKLLDNHLFLDPAFALFPLGSRRWRQLATDLRRTAYAAAARLPTRTALVLTNVLCDCPHDHDTVDEILALAERRGAPFLAVVLTVAPEELARRVADPGRTGNKLTDPETALLVASWNSLLRPADPRWVLELDSTALTPEQACARILAALEHALPYSGAVLQDHAPACPPSPALRSTP